MHFSRKVTGINNLEVHQMKIVSIFFVIGTKIVGAFGFIYSYRTYQVLSRKLQEAPLRNSIEGVTVMSEYVNVNRLIASVWLNKAMQKNPFEYSSISHDSDEH